MKKIFLKLMVLSLLSANFLYAGIGLAEALQSDARDKMDNQAKNFADAGGFTRENVAEIVAQIIQVFLSLLGIIFLILIIKAGFNWMTAGGEQEKVTTAKDTIYRAIIGLAIIVAAYAITYFVFKSLSGNGNGSSGGADGYIDYGAEEFKR